jgi:hypothetical protein
VPRVRISPHVMSMSTPQKNPFAMTMPNVLTPTYACASRTNVRTRVLIHAGVTARVFEFLDERCDARF